ncbi:MAG TPA: hypothetical protein VI306_25510 [Pyrinomonadaceae bacterium]
MDLLLRKLGRTATSSGEPENLHLDADELNAYAEKALPPTAYARYTKHIADCTQCRKTVSDLAVAAGVLVEAPAKKPDASPSGFKAFWASLFSPLVLRYSVPALILAIVATVGLLVFRTPNPTKVASNAERTQDSVAQSQSSPGSTGSGLVDQTKLAEGRSAGAPTTETKPEAPKENKSSADEERQPKDAKSDQPVPANEPSAAAAPPPPASVPAGNAGTQPAPKPSVVAQPERRADEIRTADSDAVAKQADKTAQKGPDDDKKATPKATSAGGFIVGPLATNGRAAASRPAKEPMKEKAEATRSRANAGSESEEPKRGEREDKNESETRSVAGRRFRHEGSAWIDVAYSSQATTVISRGSEQYRALVADEPGIKTIAEQLSGEVIVMWKGRAYKIR